MRRLIITLAAALALTGTGIAVAGSASGSPVLRPYSYVWKPGTRLPQLAPGETLSAWPAQATVSQLAVGKAVPMVRIGYVTASGRYIQTASARQLASVTNRNGRVNLLAEPDSTCTNPKVKKHLGLHWTAVGATYNSDPHITQAFTYETGQSSSLGVGLSDSGKAGSYNADGTDSVTSDGSQSFPANGAGREIYETKFVFNEYWWQCGPIGKVSVNSSPARACNQIISICNYYQIKATEWASGDREVHPKTTPKANFCVPLRANKHHSATFTKKTSKAVTFSAGFSLLGFTGSAQTGYDTTATVSFTIAKGHSGRLCGTNDYPGGTPKILVAKDPR